MTAPTVVSLYQLGTVAQAEARGIRVLTGWDGEPAISEDDARRWRAEQTAAGAEHARQHFDWVMATEAYVRDRLAAARAAGQAAFEANRASKGGPYATRAGEEAYRFAGEQFERTYRRPRFGGDGAPGTHLLFVRAGEEGSTVARVAGRLRGPAKVKTEPPSREVQ